jgi:hypothetical protein
MFFTYKMATKGYCRLFAEFVRDFSEATEKLPLELLNDKAIKNFKNPSGHIKKE